jgi:two-component system, OmpR family, response regulator
MQVLIIDDNTEITDMLSFYLEDNGYQCIVVNDGKEGLEAIKSQEFDLTLLDLAMPEFSGMDIIKSLKQDNLLGKKKVVVLTASTLNQDDIDSLIGDGVRTVLKKPISLDELSSIMQQFDKNS